MPAPDEDYRLREIERRISNMETIGSAPLQRLHERLDNEREVRRETAADLRRKVNETAAALEKQVDETARLLQKQLDALENTQTWAFRLVVGSVMVVATGVLIAVLSGGVG